MPPFEREFYTGISLSEHLERSKPTLNPFRDGDEWGYMDENNKANYIYEVAAVDSRHWDCKIVVYMVGGINTKKNQKDTVTNILRKKHHFKITDEPKMTQSGFTIPEEAMPLELE
jgi:hypothetical protein